MMHFCREDIFANNADPDAMPHYAAFHLGLHCLPKYLFAGNQYTRGEAKRTTAVFQSQNLAFMRKLFYQTSKKCTTYI